MAENGTEGNPPPPLVHTPHGSAQLKVENQVRVGELTQEMNRVGLTDPYGTRKIARKMVAGERMSQRRLQRSQRERDTLQQDLETARENSLIDDMTGLRNFKALREDLATTFSEAQRYGHNLSLLMFDLDNFKGINDSQGHPFGDEVIRKVAELAQTYSRGSDTVYRRSGDEFYILARETSSEHAQILGERIRNGIENELKVLLNRPDLSFSTSLGIAGYYPGVERLSPESLRTNVDQLFGNTEVALYNSKRDPEGNPLKNRVTNYQQGMVMPQGGGRGRENG